MDVVRTGQGLREWWSRSSNRLLLAIRSRGLLRALARGLRLGAVYSIQRVRRRVDQATYHARLSEVDAAISQPWPFIDLLHVPMGWQTELFQRFQHLSLQAARLGGLALYGGHPSVDRGLFVYRKIENGPHVFDATDEQVSAHLMDSLCRRQMPRILRIQSIDLSTTPDQVRRFMEDGFTVIYEYIDEIASEIVGNVPELVYRRHEQLLTDERVIVAVTSDKLLEEVRPVRSKRLLLSTNGVDLDHWRVGRPEPPRDLRPALTGRIVVGYHGAIARWIDYDLLRLIADDGRYELVLIGREHDREFRKSGLAAHPRVHFLGSKSYFELSRYAAHYDIGILPFRRSGLTDSVSPLKIFEYMAAGKPIVTTDLLECRKYRSCLMAADPAEFLSQLESASQLRNEPDYLHRLAEEAAANSWEKKMLDLLHVAGVSMH